MKMGTFVFWIGILPSLVSASASAQQRIAPSGAPSATKPTLVAQIGHSNRVTSVAFSPNGKQVLTGSYDNTAILWDLATGQMLRTFRGNSKAITSVAFSPDGKHILTGSDKNAILWNLTTGQQVRTFKGQIDWVSAIAFSPDGKQMLIGNTFAKPDEGTGVSPTLQGS